MILMQPCLAAKDAIRLSIDAALRAGSSIFILAHNLMAVPAESRDGSITVFQQTVDYLIQKNIKCVTIDEWYEGLTNPRHQSLPVGRT